MTYHFESALSGDFDFSIDWKSTGYLGLNLGTDALTKAILDTGGSADESAMAGYGAAAGAAGASAACAATGVGTAMIGACGAVGGAMGKILGGQLGKPAGGGSVAWTFADTWNGTIVPYVKSAQQGSFAIRAYLTNRDAMLDEAATIVGGTRAVALAWANQWLATRGCPPAPVNAAWSPAKFPERWEAFKRIADWASKENLGSYDFPYNGKLTATIGLQQAATGPWTDKHNEMCALKGKTGLSCFTIALLNAYPTGLPSPPDAPIDWGLVGAFQTVRSVNTKGVVGGGKAYIGCTPENCTVQLNVPNKLPLHMGWGTYPAGTILTGTVLSPNNKTPPTQPTNYPLVYADAIPSNTANSLNLKLAELRGGLITEAGKKAGKAPIVVTPPKINRFGWQAAVGGAILLASAAGAWSMTRK